MNAAATLGISLLPDKPTDRLGLALFVALVVHAGIILGVSFVPEDPPTAHTSTLDIILVQNRSQEEPEEADYLAQASQDGGGESPEKVRPSAPLPAPMEAPEPAVTAPAAPPAAPPPPPPEPAPERTVLTRESSPAKAAPAPPPPPEPVTPAPEPEPAPPAEPATPRVSAEALMSRSLEMASLSASLDERLQAYAERPRRKFINSRTKEYKYAAYMEAWRSKVERVGNLNYPDEARRRKLSGSLLLDVALNPDGSVRKITLRRSSGHKVLDDAARRIVRLAAPFAPFPEGIRKETDILHIERTWQFLGSNRLFAR